MSVLEEMLEANRRYAEAFDQGDRKAPPARKLAVLTCMDARLDPLRFLGLSLGDTHVVRNAGGRASEDALRSLTISSWLLGTEDFLVIHHTDCGMMTFTNDDLRRKLADERIDASQVDFLPFSDLEESVREDVTRLRESPLLPPGVRVAGAVYDVRSGRLRMTIGPTK